MKKEWVLAVYEYNISHVRICLPHKDMKAQKMLLLYELFDLL